MFETESDKTAEPSDTAVVVSYYAEAGKTLPVMPEGYQLERIDPVGSKGFSAARICLLVVANMETFLQDNPSLLDGDRYVIAVVDAVPAGERHMALLAAGADEVVSFMDRTQLALALRRAARFSKVRESLQRQCHNIAVERDKLQAAIDNLPSPIFFKNRAGIYSGCNKAFEGFIGLPAAKVRGSSVYDVAPEELAKVYEEADEALMRAGGVQIYDAEVRFATGEYRTVTFHKAVTRDTASGEVNGLAGAMLDITERKKLEEKLTRAAERDDLTEAYNRRRFFELATAVWERAQVPSRPLSVLVIDIDHFKQVNDRHGHACGDAALRHLVGLLDDALAQPHIFARAGGEEFYCLLEDCAPDLALTIAEAIRDKVEATPHLHEEQDIPLRVSIGVATIRKGETVNQAIARADAALYRAKEAGRNRVCSD